MKISTGQIYERKKILSDLIDALYNRSHEPKIKRGEFKMLGDILTIHPSNQDIKYKIHFFGNEIENIETINNTTEEIYEVNTITITPANIFITSKNDKKQAKNYFLVEECIKGMAFAYRNIELNEEALSGCLVISRTLKTVTVPIPDLSGSLWASPVVVEGT